MCLRAYSTTLILILNIQVLFSFLFVYLFIIYKKFSFRYLLNTLYLLIAIKQTSIGQINFKGKINKT
jgi:hypothetical protein